MKPLQRETFTAEVVKPDFDGPAAPALPGPHIRIGNAAGTAMVPLDDAAGLAHWLLEAAWRLPRPGFRWAADEQ